MHRNYWILTFVLALAVACAASPAMADPVETTTAHFVINSPAAGNAEFDIENPEVGDVETFFTDSGEQITVTYDQAGFLLDVAGEEIRVAVAGANALVLPDGAHGFVFEDEGGQQIVVDVDGGPGQAMVWHSDDGDGEGGHAMVWHSEDSEGGEGGEGGVKREVHVIRRGDATVELLEDGQTKVIEIPGGDDIQVLKTKDENGNIQVKVLRNGEEIDPSELKGGEGHGMNMVFVGDDDGDAGQHVIKLRQVKGEGDGEPHEVKVLVEKMIDGEPGASSGTQIQVKIEKKIEEQ
jgi:hypothetical protein